MRLVGLHVRFFRSFNYDFERKNRRDNHPAAWEETTPAWYPFVRIPIERDITAVVGANESGKSQLLTAIEAVLTGEPIERSDFCRYSELYSVKEGEVRKPEFGGTFEVEPGDVDGIEALYNTSKFSFFRPGDGPPFVVVNDQKVDLQDSDLELLENRLPQFQKLRTSLAIPSSVSIQRMAGEGLNLLQDRARRSKLLNALEKLEDQPAQAVGKVVAPLLIASDSTPDSDAVERQEAEFLLAQQLLVDVAGVEVSEFKELERAISEGREGQVAAIVGGINSAIRENLNIQRWWTQDREFDLLVEAREYELVFTIQDKTNSRYSFSERSQGLRFFLSYFVQLRAHRHKTENPEILLLDEPDAFLSSVGQQDLLRVLHEYAQPEDNGPESQVIYVTHSPFLIDKNAPHRIRVLDKGSEDEGTRVVRDAANNRYEPLRSSLGAYVAETAFIGGKNLFVEGMGDQILLTGVATFVSRAEGAGNGILDLNEVTVVASGGADGVPYLVYLARGRDSVKPACVALLDGDQAGRQAEEVLRGGEARGKRVLNPQYIVRLDKWAEQTDLELEDSMNVLEIEDLIPTTVAHEAALNFLARFIDLDDIVTQEFTPKAIQELLTANEGRLWPALQAAYVNAFPNEHLEKVGFAREVIRALESDTNYDDKTLLTNRFSALLVHLSGVLDDAQREEYITRSDDRLKRTVKSFLQDHRTGIKKTTASRVLRDLSSALGDSRFDDELKTEISAITREFKLTDLADLTVSNFTEFKDRIASFNTRERLAYQDDAMRNPAATVLKTERNADSPHIKENPESSTSDHGADQAPV